jgi:hypothetical protein
MVELLELDQDHIFALRTAAAAGMKGLAVALAKLNNERQVAQFRRRIAVCCVGLLWFAGSHNFLNNPFQRFHCTAENGFQTQPIPARSHIRLADSPREQSFRSGSLYADECAQACLLKYNEDRSCSVGW